MSNFTLDSNNFSEQLGIYDFFNVVLNGAVFVSGISLINSNAYDKLCENISFFKGIVLILVIYTIGMIIQELGSLVDKKILNIYRSMSNSLLKPHFRYEKTASNGIVENPLLLNQYQINASDLLNNSYDSTKKDFKNNFVNGYFFATCQYLVSIYGKDKKVEKLRALFDMSLSIMVCFVLLALFTFVSLFSNVNMSVDICNLMGFNFNGFEYFIDKFIMMIVFSFMAYVFYIRAKRTMKNFLLILLGTYDAILRVNKSQTNND